MRWIQTDKDHAAKVCTQAILDLSPLADPGLLAIPDITFLAPSQELGLAVVHELRERGIQVLHTFSKDARESRRLKVAFFLNEEGKETAPEGSEARIKATTLHSFKGWETRALVLYTGHNLSRRSLALTYAGLTRVKANVERSYVTVVSAMPELRAVWPAFQSAQRSTSQIVLLADGLGTSAPQLRHVIESQADSIMSPPV